MLLHEYQAKKIFAEEGIAVPSGVVVRNEGEMEACLQSLKPPYFLKAQILSGGRGKAGAVRRAKTPEEALTTFGQMKGMVVKTSQQAGRGLVVDTLLVESGAPLACEYYLAIVVDRARSCPVLITSRKGGMDIEEVSRTEPDSVLTLPLDVSRGVPDHVARRVHYFWANPAVKPEETAKLLRALFNVFLKNDAIMAEVNPLGSTADGRLIAVDAKLSLDENAFFRHPEWTAYEEQNTHCPEEAEAAEHGLSYIKLDKGSIGCMVNGAGLAMATMDLITLYGGSPANFLDVGGRATAEGTAAAFNIIRQDPAIRAVLVNIFGGIVQCDLIAGGLLAASEAVDIRLPLVIRLEGTRAEIGLAMIKDSGKAWVVERDFSKAVKRAVELSKGGA